MIQLKTYTAQEANIISFEPLPLYQLSALADEIVQAVSRCRPEFALLVKLQRDCGCRIQELFQPNRWTRVTIKRVQIQPQKGNAARVLEMTEIGIPNSDTFDNIKADMERLPNRQYERAVKAEILARGIWRLYDNGFAHPSTHMFRHIKIQELAAAGNDKAYIANWIGEKSEDNLDYYLNSRYYI